MLVLPKKKKCNISYSSTSEEISTDTEIQLRKLGKRETAAIIELSAASPNRGTTIKKARISFLQKPATLSPEQALVLMVDNGLSTRQYQRIREQAENLNCKLYPPYHKVKESKQLCYPHGISVTKTSAEITLQTVVDHTVSRICHIEFVTEKLRLSTNTTFEVIMKWGCDGSEQTRYKQKFSEESFSDENLFSICVVSRQIHSSTDDSKSVIWKNPVPSSIKYCRPIKFIFAKESTDLITAEVEKIKHQIKELEPTKIFFDLEISVTPTLIICIVDGKVCNAVSSCSSTQTCYLCRAKPNEMNNLRVISKKEASKEFLTFGISPLHPWIRLMEYVLHISYWLDIKTWQTRGAEKKEKVSQKKKSSREI
ncbi:hypothetical protein AVEN_207351-1 [Araneus ventricosus]|uniref:Uncharacterized protein n=1 Tax=Araneus ventricosus TaxID=182803 RepID=A0A4Y2URE7_ARAVE|nr:hypothetical protein AVEN_207351-1 [Araneus ventricosus]